MTFLDFIYKELFSWFYICKPQVKRQIIPVVQSSFLITESFVTLTIHQNFQKDYFYHRFFTVFFIIWNMYINIRTSSENRYKIRMVTESHCYSWLLALNFKCMTFIPDLIQNFSWFYTCMLSSDQGQLTR